MTACEKAGPIETSSGSGSGVAITSGGVPAGSRVVPPATVPAGRPTDPGGNAAVDAGVAAAVTPDAQVRPPVAPRRRPADLDTAALQAQAAAMARLLTDDGHTTADIDMSHRRPGADLGSAIADVRGVGGGAVQIGGGGSRGGTGRSVGTAQGPTTSPPDPAVRVWISGKQAQGATSLTADAVAGKIIAAYTGGLKHCYRDVLTRDPSRAGQLALAFEVTPTGRVIGVQVGGVEPTLDHCVEHLATAWRFAVPKDADGEPVSAHFTITLELAPPAATP
jgi:hypothetical protein